MTDQNTQADSGSSNTEKDPDDWVTGDEPMTGAQRSYLTTLSEEAKVDVDLHLSKADASKRIDELQKLTGRGSTHVHDDAPPTQGAAPGAGAAPARHPAPASHAAAGSAAGDESGADDELDFDGNGSRDRQA